jgi:hypothetical protein
MKLVPVHRRRGQALTELALLLPLLALLLVGLIEFGFLLYAHVQVSSAAREGARAASLYNAIRFSAFNDEDLRSGGNVKIPTCGSIDGWSLQHVIESAVVRRQPSGSGSTKGCYDPNGAIIYSALGQLDPTRAPVSTPLPMPCPTGDVGGWVAGVHSTSPAFTQTKDNKPSAGGRATITLCHPYRLIILSDLLPFLDEPVWINKSVNFEFQP